MFSMMKLVALSLVVGLVCGDITPPIPVDSEDPGFRLNPAALGAQVKLEAFLELNCGDSAFAWPILQQLAEHYGPEKLDVVVHQFPLPYHRQCFLCTQGLSLVRDQQPDAAAAYITEIFDNIGRFGDFVTRNMNQLEVTDMLAEIQEPATGIDRADFAADIRNFYFSAIKQWKYGARRNVAGTPWFFVNNVDFAVNPSIRLSFDDWLEILDPIIDPVDVQAKPETLLKVMDSINTSNLKKGESSDDKKPLETVIKQQLKPDKPVKKDGKPFVMSGKPVKKSRKPVKKSGKPAQKSSINPSRKLADVLKQIAAST